MKHHWWDLLYKKIRIHSDIFFDFIFNENLLLYDYINWLIVRRSNFSSCMRIISNHNSYFIIVNYFFFFWTAANRSYRNHQMKLIIIDFSKFKKNQNTIEQNKFYEWKIWKTIMKIINENNFICIKINSWFHKISSAFFLSNVFFQQLIFFLIWFDQTKFRQHFFLSSILYRSTFQQLIFSKSNENFVSIHFYHRFIQININWND